MKRPQKCGGEPRKNPERVSRRQTRSMGDVESLSTAKGEELELSLEEELLEVRVFIYQRPCEKHIPASCFFAQMSLRTMP